MKDIKTMIKETTLEETKGLSPNHRALFEQKLNSAMATKKITAPLEGRCNSCALFRFWCCKYIYTQITRASKNLLF